MRKDLLNKLLWVGIVVLVIVLGVWLVKKNKTNEEEVKPEITLESSKQMGSEADLKMPMTDAEKKAVEESFKKEGSEITSLTDVSGGEASGTAFRMFDGEKFYHKVEAKGLSSLEKGFFYEEWLVGEAGFFSTGRMMVINGEGSLYYVADEDKSDFRGVVVTLESEDGDPTPGSHVLEGSF